MRGGRYAPLAFTTLMPLHALNANDDNLETLRYSGSNRTNKNFTKAKDTRMWASFLKRG